MVITRNDFEYYITSANEIIICGAVDKNIKELVIPSHINRFPVVSIEREVFKGLQQLTTVKIPDTMELIGNFAFEDCPKLAFVVSEASELVLGMGTFRNCNKLKVFANRGLLHCGVETFKDCHKLENFEANVTCIKRGTFSGCRRLRSVHFSKQLSSFDGKAFCDCRELSCLFFEGHYARFKNMRTEDFCNVTIFCTETSSLIDLAPLGYSVCVRDYL